MSFQKRARKQLLALSPRPTAFEVPLPQRSQSRQLSPKRVPSERYSTPAARTHLVPPGLLTSQAAPTVTLADLPFAQQQQTLLLQQQLAFLQEKQASTQQYSDPFKVLNCVDPDLLKPVLIEWMKECKATLQHHVMQSDLQMKYPDIKKAGDLQRALAEEATKEWQWP